MPTNIRRATIERIISEVVGRRAADEDSNEVEDTLGVLTAGGMMAGITNGPLDEALTVVQAAYEEGRRQAAKEEDSDAKH